jgi:hypothetical protein
MKWSIPSQVGDKVLTISRHFLNFLPDCDIFALVRSLASTDNFLKIANSRQNSFVRTS